MGILKIATEHITINYVNGFRERISSALYAEKRKQWIMSLNATTKKHASTGRRG